MRHDNSPSAPDAAAPFFSARLTPYRSLGPRGFLALMAFVSALCFIGGTAFWAIGAWPVVGFFGLDVALVYLALRASYAQARAYEEVHLSNEALVIRKVSPRGQASEVVYQPAWVRLLVEREEDEGVVRLAVTSHGRTTEVGGFLDPDGREDFGRAFGAALALARAGGPG